MDNISKTKEILAAYESVCERQRVTIVRNTALLKDVERVQRLLAGHQHNQTQLNTLKSRYQQYVASVYPGWLASCNSHQRSNGLPQTTTNALITHPTTSTHTTLTTGTHTTNAPTTHSHTTPTTDAPTTHSHTTPTTDASTTHSHITPTTDAQTIPTADAHMHTTPITHSHTTGTDTTPTTELHTTDATTTPITEPLTTPTTVTHTTLTTNAHTTLATLNDIKTRPTAPVNTVTVLPSSQKSFQPIIQQPNSLTPQQIAPTDLSLDFTLSSYSMSTESFSVEDKSAALELKIESIKNGTESTHTRVHTDEPQTLNHDLNKLEIAEPLQANTIPTHTLLVEDKQTGTTSNTSNEPFLKCTPSKPLFEDEQTSTAQNHALKEEITQASVSSMDESELSQTATRLNRTVTVDNSPPSTHHSNTPPSTLHSYTPPPPPQLTMSPPPTLVRVSSLPSPTPSPSLPPPTPTRSSSLPPHTPSPPHSHLNREKIVTNLLSTLNAHLAGDKDAIAMEMYSEPVDSDKMKLKISASSVLSSNIIKSANQGLDCSTWDVSVVGVVLLNQLSLLTAAHGSLIDDSLLSEDILLITHPVHFKSPWSQIWAGLLENVQLLHRAGRPLDELAAIFTPPLFITPSEKACCQLLALFRLNMDDESDDEESVQSHDQSINLPGVTPTSTQARDGLLDYSALGIGDISDQSSLFSEDSVVLAFEKTLSLKSPSQSVAIEATTRSPPPLSTPPPLFSPIPLSSSSDESSVVSPPKYIPTILENSVPGQQSRISNSSSLRRRLGLHDSSDSDLDEENDLLTPRKQNTEDDFDFKMHTSTF